jgi:hypothetical protein
VRDRRARERGDGKIEGLTATALRLIIINCSALCIKKAVNFRHKMISISSACLILIETLTELMEGSMRQRSFSVLEIVNDCNKSSLFPLYRRQTNRESEKENVTFIKRT